MKYAPIIITTLNRYEHLERCLRSLANNTLAKQTELFIGVDYPPSEKYEFGYRKVLEFFKKNSFLETCFKKVKVFYHKKNLGPDKNVDFLLNYVKQYYNTYVATEDDNVFSCNFLEYVNVCLNVFYKDDRVIGICGCKEAEWLKNNINDSVIAGKLYSAYGMAAWFDKNDEFNALISKLLLSNKSLFKYKKLRQNNRLLYNLYVLSVMLGDKKPFWLDGKLRPIDSVKSIFMHLTDKICIVPSVSKSHTTGNDGSGVNMKRIEGLNPDMCWPLDNSEKFNLIISDELVTTDNYKRVNLNFIDYNYLLGSSYMNMLRSKMQDVKADLGLILLIMCDFNRNRAMKIKKIIKAVLK